MIKNTLACKVILRNWERQICGKTEDCFKKICIATLGCLELGWMFILRAEYVSVTRNITVRPANRILPVITILCDVYLFIFIFFISTPLHSDIFDKSENSGQKAAVWEAGSEHCQLLFLLKY